LGDYATTNTKTRRREEREGATEIQTRWRMSTMNGSRKIAKRLPSELLTLRERLKSERYFTPNCCSTVAKRRAVRSRTVTTTLYTPVGLFASMFTGTAPRPVGRLRLFAW
jgi:hypothetical protein